MASQLSLNGCCIPYLRKYCHSNRVCFGAIVAAVSMVTAVTVVAGKVISLEVILRRNRLSAPISRVWSGSSTV